MKYIVGFSGGIDSTFVAWLLKKQGHQVLLVNLKNTAEPNKCCGLDIQLFQLADKLGLKLEIVNVIEQFKNLVINEFIKEYSIGQTPNPCINCNEYIRFFVLNQVRQKYGFDKISTGHYTQTHHTDLGTILKKGIDTKKDQSYMLYRLVNKPFLQYIDFLMGKFKKEEVKKIILQENIPYLSMDESQNICFIPNDDYTSYIKKNSNILIKPGPILNIEGKYLGKHQGIIYYTIGQRKGLNISSNKKLFVIKIDYKNNTLIVGEERFLYKDKIEIQDFIHYDWVSLQILQKLAKQGNLWCKIRYQHSGEKIKDIKKEQDQLIIYFKNPVKAPTPGQHLVIYSQDIVLGGGRII